MEHPTSRKITAALEKGDDGDIATAALEAIEQLDDQAEQLYRITNILRVSLGVEAVIGRDVVDMAEMTAKLLGRSIVLAKIDPWHIDLTERDRDQWFDSEGHPAVTRYRYPEQIASEIGLPDCEGWSVHLSFDRSMAVPSFDLAVVIWVLHNHHTTDYRDKVRVR